MRLLLCIEPPWLIMFRALALATGEGGGVSCSLLSPVFVVVRPE